MGLALHACAVVDRVDICEVLLQAGADIYALDPFGRTALHVAAAHGSTAVLDALLVADYAKELNFKEQCCSCSRPRVPRYRL